MMNQVNTAVSIWCWKI